MVIVSDDVRNVVNRIFLIGIAYKGRIPNMYGQIISAFEKLESSVANVNASSVNSAPLAWRRYNVGFKSWLVNVLIYQDNSTEWRNTCYSP